MHAGRHGAGGGHIRVQHPDPQAAGRDSRLGMGVLKPENPPPVTNFP